MTVIDVDAHLEHPASIAKLTLMNVIVILVGMEPRALMASTNTRASVFLVIRDYIAKQTLTSVLQIHARTEVFVSIWLTAIDVNVLVVITTRDA